MSIIEQNFIFTNCLWRDRNSCATG
uniref:Uncharacterized protein n=1 Tax=Anguilla anguilla TaxID=7936 RepID=A0A0E9U3Y0_ANGAN